MFVTFTSFVVSVVFCFNSQSSEKKKKPKRMSVVIADIPMQF